ncbi:MAG: NAD-dependent succinate-semialdehyde dehydrogenase [Rhizobiaceae bacterium]|nr:NAD-dependent succinate-semialdehyde dehydrogenase [Rhizobiaceae bacterium]
MPDHLLLIGGRRRPASDGGSLPLLSPVTEQSIGSIAAATASDLHNALRAAESGLAAWRRIPAWERAGVLRKVGDLIRSRVETIAAIVTQETGKPLAEARGETLAAADQFEWYAEEAKRIYGQIIPGRTPQQRMAVLYEPVGVCVALTAWNFPVLLPARKLAAALAAGCSVVLKPAGEAPGAAFALADACLDAGLPADAIGVVTGDANFISATLVADQAVRKVSLTGSVRVGKIVAGLAAEGLKRVSMELGGHAPVIVHADADPIAAAQALATAKFRNAGQVCISPSRFFVHRSIERRFVETFADVARATVVGDGAVEGVTMGPLISRRALDRANDVIADAVGKGAAIAAGGRRPPQLNAGHFLEPTVLSNVAPDSRIMAEEPFAPVAPIFAFDRVQDAVKQANALPFGLAGYVFTDDLDRAQLTAEALEVGMVGVNEVLLATAEGPFGGVKESGFGREGGSLGIHDYLSPKFVRQKLKAAAL